MANPTTNFGWVMPTTTDLVTDLPADFNTFGQGVDTSMAELLGGTTGQILSKTSATNMDFTWINNDQGDITGVTAGTGISGGGTSGTVTVSIDTAVTADLTTAQTMTNKTLTTPKISNYTTNGDLVYGTGSSVITRLGIGSTSQVLTVTGGVPVWATPAANSSGLTLISTTTFTAAASQSINSVFTSTYTNYRVILNLTSCTSDQGMRMRLRLSGTDATGSNYLIRNMYISGNSTFGAEYSTQTTWYYGSANATGGVIITDISNPNLARPTYMTGQNLSDTNNQSNGLVHNLSTAYDGFTVYNTSAVNMTGTISVYGYQI